MIDKKEITLNCNVYTLNCNVYTDKVEFDWHELKLKHKIKVAVAILLGGNFIICAKINYVTRIGGGRLLHKV